MLGAGVDVVFCVIVKFATVVAGTSTGVATGGVVTVFDVAPLSIIAIALPISTVSPSGNNIFVRVPANGEGTSLSTLSVAISKTASSRATESPSFFNHLSIFASMILSPNLGIIKSAIIFSIILNCKGKEFAT